MTKQQIEIKTIGDAEEAINSMLAGKGYDLVSIGRREGAGGMAIYWAHALNTWGVVVTIGSLHIPPSETAWQRLTDQVSGYVRHFIYDA